MGRMSATMRPMRRLIAAAVLAALGTALAACSGGGINNFDPSDMLDFMDTKKKLPGERRPVFPEGVPGIEQGVPSDLYRGNAEHQQHEAAEQQMATEPPQAAPPAATRPSRAAKPARPAKRAARPAPPPAEEAEPVPVRPPPPPASPPQQSQQSSPPFPAPLPSGSFAR